MDVIRRGVALVCWFAALLSGSVARAELGWDPETTWVFAVGLLEWQHSDEYPSFPAAVPNRRDRQLVEFFRKAGVPAERIVYLEDRQATKKKIEQEFARQLAESEEGDLLVFYFAGHGARERESGATYFVNYDAGESWASHWRVGHIFDQLEKSFRGDRVLMMADCCHSGALYDEARQRKSRLSFACLSSVYSHDTSTGNWTFTDTLLKGFRGSALVDENDDRYVELKELANYTELDMAFIEQQKSMFIATGDFSPQMKLATTKRDHPKGLGLRVEVLWKEKWYKAQIIGSEQGQWKVHYLGFGNEWDEVVTPERIRTYMPQTYAPGTRVSVHWSDGKWYPATVRSSWYGLHLVRYDGFGPEWNEWVGIKNVRPL